MGHALSENAACRLKSSKSPAKTASMTDVTSCRGAIARTSAKFGWAIHAGSKKPPFTWAEADSSRATPTASRSGAPSISATAGPPSTSSALRPE
jgi:hypothetical protein